MADTVSQIKERLDIADFLRGYLQLTPAGKNLKARCPFHQEKSPSFMVSPERQTWHCFGCALGGDIISFVMRYENIEFFEALKILAEKARVDIKQSGSQDQRQLNGLYEANKAAKDFFKNSLTPAALDYLKSRGLKPETIEEFGVGFAPDNPDVLSRHLVNAGYTMAFIEKAGLTLKTERGTYLDRFRNRIMFPIANAFGKVVGFTGRIMPGFESEKIGKYVNSPETPIFNKSKLLYGFDKTKNFIREKKTAVLVEGQMDFLMAWQDGLKNLTATSGTALTIDHLRSIKRIADSLVFSFDNDDAGQNATERSIDLAGSADLSIRILRLPPDLKAKDPADIALSNPGLLAQLVESAQPAMDYYFSRYDVSKKTNMVEWKKNIRTVLGKIKSLWSAIEQSHWVKEVAARSGVDEAHLLEEMEAIKVNEPKLDVPETQQKNEDPVSRKDLIAQRMATLVIDHKDLYSSAKNIVDVLPENYQKIIAYHIDDKSISLSVALQPVADLVSLRSGLETIDLAMAKKEIEELGRQYRLETLKDKKGVLRQSIAEAEKRGNDEAVLAASTELQKIAEEMTKLYNK